MTADEMRTILSYAMTYFANRPRSMCVACNQLLEARPGVRMCRTCLDMAGACLEAIRAKEEAEKAGRP